jgi:thiosulfate/3-mercaptopyruvate sulfurtransferase
MHDVFVSVKELGDKQFKWIDARFSLQSPEEGRKKYESSHVVGAVYWDLEKDMSDMKKRTGRHPMPNKMDLINLFRKSGLELDDAIIVYDDGGSPFAARAWWLLQYAGFNQSFIALEGFGTIKELGIPVDDNQVVPTPTQIAPTWNEAIFADREFVKEIVNGSVEGKLLDARSATRYRGEQEPIDPIAGRIPGALNFDWEQLKSDGIYRVDERVNEQLNSVVNSSDSVTVYCGSGVTAAPLYAMLAHHGYLKLQLYVGSYSDWITEEEAVIEKD